MVDTTGDGTPSIPDRRHRRLIRALRGGGNAHRGEMRRKGPRATEHEGDAPARPLGSEDHLETHRGSRATGGLGTVRRIIAVIVMATGILLALPSYPVDASRVPDLQCGVTPTSSVRLRTDLTCSAPFTLPTDSPVLTIDLGGHTLTFTDPTCTPGPPISR